MELINIEKDLLPERKDSLDKQLDVKLEELKLNQKKLNRFVMQGISCLTAAKARSRELASQGFFSSLWGSITGSNREMRASIDQNNAEAIYAAQKAIKKLAQQNAMSFELIAAVNNKLNTSVENIEEDILKVKEWLIKLFKQSRSDIVQLSTRMDAVERNVNLERWHDTIEYLMYDGTEYGDLDFGAKLICVINDFYVKSEGNWNFSDILLLKATLSELGVNVKDNISMQDFVGLLMAKPELRDRLLQDIEIGPVEPYTPCLATLEKLSALQTNEKYIVDTVASITGTDDSNTIVDNLLSKYAIANLDMNYEAKFNVFEFSLGLLANIKMLDMRFEEKEEIIEEVQEVVVEEAEEPEPEKIFATKDNRILVLADTTDHYMMKYHYEEVDQGQLIGFCGAALNLKPKNPTGRSAQQSLQMRLIQKCGGESSNKKDVFFYSDMVERLGRVEAPATGKFFNMVKDHEIIELKQGTIIGVISDRQDTVKDIKRWIASLKEQGMMNSYAEEKKNKTRQRAKCRK